MNIGFILMGISCLLFFVISFIIRDFEGQGRDIDQRL